MSKREPYVRVAMKAGGDVAIWLEPIEGVEGEGLCLGIGETLPEALEHTFNTIAETIEQLGNVVAILRKEYRR